MRRLPARVRDDEAGFTLVELLVGMVIGSVILTALMTIFTHGLLGTYQVTDRVDAARTGRITLDRMTQLLQAQTCLASAAPLLAASSTSVTFYGTLGGPDADPEKYTLTFNAAARTITEYDYDPIDAADGSVSYAATPTRTEVIGTNIVVNGLLPVFKYWAFSSTGTTAGEPVQLAAPLSAANVQLVIRVDIAFTTLPPRIASATDPRAADMTGEAIVSSADASQPNKGPNC